MDYWKELIKYKESGFDKLNPKVKRWLRELCIQDANVWYGDVDYFRIRWIESGFIYSSNKRFLNLTHLKNIGLNELDCEEWIILNCSFTVMEKPITGLFETGFNSFTVQKTFKVRTKALQSIIRDNKINNLLDEK